MPALDPDRYPGLSLESFLDQVASPSPAPGGGSVAAVATALAAGLCSMAARKSPRFPGGAAATADARRQQALSLASRDALAYGRVLEAQRAVGAFGSVEPAVENPLLTAALGAAADVPLELAGVAAEIAALARDLVVSGNPNLAGDSLTAALLAAAAAGAAADLVAINLAGMPEAVAGDRVERASTFAAQAGSAAGRARAAAREGVRQP